MQVAILGTKHEGSYELRLYKGTGAKAGLEMRGFPAFDGAPLDVTSLDSGQFQDRSWDPQA